MKENLNEANVKLDIVDLNSSDMQTLSQILSLAGSAESSSADAMGSVTDSAPEISAISVAGPEIMDEEMLGDPMGVSAGDDMLGDPMDNPDISAGAPSMEMGEEISTFEDDGMDNFMEDLDRLASLGGITEMENCPMQEEGDICDECGMVDCECDHMNEEVYEDVEHLNEEMCDDCGCKMDNCECDHDDSTECMEAVEHEDDEHDEDDEDSDKEHVEEQESCMEALDRISELAGISASEDKLDEMRLMPNLDLDEGTVGEMGSVGIGNNKMYGPYKSQLEAQNEAISHLGGGSPGVNFKIINKPDGYYWTENVNEDITNRPDEMLYDDTPIVNSRHAVEPKKPNLGDNTMQSVEELHESLNAAYAKFLKK